MVSRILVLLMAVVLIASMGCESDVTSSQNNRYSADETFVYRVARASRSAFLLEGVNGIIEVAGGPNVESVGILGVKRVKSHSMLDAENRLDELTVEIDSTDTAVSARTEQPAQTDGREYIVNYSVTLPEDFKVTITTANGDTKVRSIKNDVVVSVANGVILGDALAGNTSMTLANGSITASVVVPPGGGVSLGIANGDIYLRIPENTSAEFVAVTTNGKVEVRNLTLTNMEATATSISGTLGDGNGLISLEVANGDIIAEGI
ncbi:MAG: DUF4097 family beta strand repeat protein [Candidatus Latescibacterota bacterium]|nr:MAG: DUF4097 family beta strand repeat protein [Candidatus Latescibacterota bacterium]